MRKYLSFLLASALFSFNAWAHPSVDIVTTAGKVTLELYPEKAPKTVESFLQNARHGFYEGTIFHRVIEGFMIQGGGFNSVMEEKTPRTPALPNEADNGLTNERGTIAMARTADPHSARVQFFINLKNNAFLNFRSPTQGGYGYAVFGRVTQGMDVIDRIAKSPTGSVGHYENVPTKPVIIQSIKIISEK